MTLIIYLKLMLRYTTVNLLKLSDQYCSISLQIHINYINYKAQYIFKTSVINLRLIIEYILVNTFQSI